MSDKESTGNEVERSSEICGTCGCMQLYATSSTVCSASGTIFYAPTEFIWVNSEHKDY